MFYSISKILFLTKNFLEIVKILTSRWQMPKCELPKLIIRHNIGLISAANSWLLLLGQWHSLYRPNAELTTAAFVDCSNLLTFSRHLAQYRPYTKPIITFNMASSSESRRAKCWRPEFGPELAANCIPELSFHQRHDIGNRSSATF